jgi:hypothetical protein
MSTDTVSIGCRLPNGLTLEVGYSVNAPGSANGAPFARYQRHADYAQFNLKGLNQHSLLRDPNTRRILTTLASQRDREPVVSQVPADLWQRWKKEHANSWLLKSGQVFEIPKTDAATVKAATKDAKAVSPAIFEPIDPAVAMKLGENILTKRADEYLD